MNIFVSSQSHHSAPLAKIYVVRSRILLLPRSVMSIAFLLKESSLGLSYPLLPAIFSLMHMYIKLPLPRDITLTPTSKSSHTTLGSSSVSSYSFFSVVVFFFCRSICCSFQLSLRCRPICCSFQISLRCRPICCSFQLSLRCRPICCSFQLSLRCRPICCSFQLSLQIHHLPNVCPAFVHELCLSEGVDLDWNVLR